MSRLCNCRWPWSLEASSKQDHCLKSLDCTVGKILQNSLMTFLFVKLQVVQEFSLKTQNPQNPNYYHRGRWTDKNSNLISFFEVKKTQLDPFLDSEGQPDLFEPKKRVGFGSTYVVIVDKCTDLSLMHLREETQLCYYAVVFFFMLTSTDIFHCAIYLHLIYYFLQFEILSFLFLPAAAGRKI